MYKLITALITGALISVSGFVLAQVPVKVALDGAQPTRQEQNKNQSADKLRTGGKEQASQSQPSPSPRNAAFIVFLSLVYGRK